MTGPECLMVERRTLQQVVDLSTPTKTCVVRKLLKTRRRGFGDRTSRSARRPAGTFFFGSQAPAGTPQDAAIPGKLSEP